jgi:hypothetical protein
MTTKVFKALVQIALPVLVAAFALPAFGEDVTFTTTGSWNCNGLTVCGTSGGGSIMTVTNNGNTATVQAVGDSYSDIIAGPSPQADVNVVTFNDTSTNNTAPSGPVNLAGALFTLTINQTTPTVGSGSLTGSLFGTIYYTGTTAYVDFSTGSLVLGNVTYVLDNPSNWALANPGNSVGMEVFTAQVLPEPTFMLLTGLGFAGVAFVAYRRRRAVQV